MGFKNFLISIIRSLIVLTFATLIFSTITLDFSNLIENIFGDIFVYASPEAQKQTISRLTETCSSLEQGQGALTINQICTNKSLIDSMKKDCDTYRELKRRNIKIGNEEQIKETCLQLESGELEKACNEMQKSSLVPDFSSIGSLCKDYKAGKISDKEFFFNVISGALPSNIQMPQIGFLEKYNQTINYLNKNKIIYFIILLISLIILYLLIMNVKIFLIVLSQISFSIGILIMLPYFAIITYDKFVGIDTTSILGSIFGLGNAFDPKAILSVVLLMFLRTYNSFILILGSIFLAIGIAGKVYNFIFKKSRLKENNIKERK